MYDCVHNVTKRWQHLIKERAFLKVLNIVQVGISPCQVEAVVTHSYSPPLLLCLLSLSIRYFTQPILYSTQNKHTYSLHYAHENHNNKLTLYQKVMDIVIPPFGKDSMKCHLNMYIQEQSCAQCTTNHRKRTEKEGRPNTINKCYNCLSGLEIYW